MARKPTLADPWNPVQLHPDFKQADAVAIQALWIGEANPDQQKRILPFLINTLCATYDQSYRPDHDRDTVFAEGKRWIGNQIVKLTKINISQLKDKD